MLSGTWAYVRSFYVQKSHVILRMILAKKHKNRFGVWWHDESLKVHIELKPSKVPTNFKLNGTVIIIMR